jgi:phosphatidylglycerol---prolipoprotein diacylglyceryl transferase
MLAYLQWNPKREIFDFTLPLIGRPILWYGLFFGLGCYLAYLIFHYLVKRYFLTLTPEKGKAEIGEMSHRLVEKCSGYLLIGLIVGARLGDVLFYQDWRDYLADPLSIFMVWKGGLASHGAAVGILLGLFLFSRKMKMNWLELLDLLVIPACIAAAFIRIGNFFNQEVLGTASDLPWAVLFLHPIDGSAVVPRHPVQLYEALFYLLLALVLMKAPKRSGLFLIALFTFRFFIEFIKEEQSALFASQHALTMGQLLSIPFVIFGVWLFIRRKETFSPIGKIKGEHG